MHAINWLELQPTQAEVNALNESIHFPVHAREVRKRLVELILHSHRNDEENLDLLPYYDPSHVYFEGEWLALPIYDQQELHPTTWQIARVGKIEESKDLNQIFSPDVSENLKKYRVKEGDLHIRLEEIFQILYLDLYDDSQAFLVGAAKNSRYHVPNFRSYHEEDLKNLATLLEDSFAKRIQRTLQDLSEKGELQGEFANDTFLPRNTEKLALNKLVGFFRSLSAAEPWITTEKILAGLPELSQIDRQQALHILQASLSKSPYKSLGNDYWTTPELFEQQMYREVERGLPVPRVRSKLELWTDEDLRDFEIIQPDEEVGEDDIEFDEFQIPPDTSLRAEIGEWRAPKEVQLPTLSYLHITQAYFPLGKISSAFAPQTNLAFIQIIKGEHLAFLVDREQGVLSAKDIKGFRVKFLESDMPAGTYLWLEYQGGNKYRISPRPQAEKLIPCKLAKMKNGKLHITQTEIPMRYEGDTSVFKADMRFSEIDALFEEARKANLSIRDAIIYAVQEICTTDPKNRAHREDVFNTVYLKRMCSPNSVRSLLSQIPCVESLGNGYFRYMPELRNLPVTKKKHQKSAQKDVHHIFVEDKSQSNQNYGIDLRGLIGQPLATLRHRQVFVVTHVKNGFVFISLNSEHSESKQIQIPLEKISKAWEEVRQGQYAVWEKSSSRDNDSAFVAVIILRHNEVVSDDQKQKLFWVVPDESPKPESSQIRVLWKTEFLKMKSEHDRVNSDE